MPISNSRGAILADTSPKVEHPETATDLRDAAELADNIRDSVSATRVGQGLQGQLGATSARHIRLSTAALALFCATVLAIDGCHRNNGTLPERLGG